MFVCFQLIYAGVYRHHGGCGIMKNGIAGIS